MGSNTNFKNFGDSLENFPLARQSSIYSLTFDEFQNAMGGIGKDFGSMNMDELLKSIWSAEETQILASGVGAGAGGSDVPSGNLQRQGSLTLPRTLSQKTVDEVWRDFVKESDVGKESQNNGVSEAINLPQKPQRQQTLGEMTLEEFLVIAGVVREEPQPQPQSQPIGRPNNNIVNNPTNDLCFGFQQPVRNNGIFDNRVTQENNSARNQPPNLPMSFGGFRTSQPQIPQKPKQQQQRQQPLFGKPAATMAFSPPTHLVSNAQLTSAGAGATNQIIAGINEPAVNAALAHTMGLPPCGGGVSIANSLGGCGRGGVTVAAVSPTSHLSPDVIPKTCVDSPTSLSPVPYMFNRRGKCSAALEKVIERRQRRMIKNRESAARSRARKQAYTLELEAEVAKLKEVNEELQKKQEELLEMQKNQILETMDRQWQSKRQCLRRTVTGPW